MNVVGHMSERFGFACIGQSLWFSSGYCNNENQFWSSRGVVYILEWQQLSHFNRNVQGVDGKSNNEIVAMMNGSKSGIQELREDNEELKFGPIRVKD